MSKLAATLGVVGSSLRNRGLRLALIAFALFSVAEWVRWVGLLVYGFDKAGASGVGLISVAQLTPAALITPFSSSLADRFPRAKVLGAAYLLSGIGTCVAGLGIAADMPFWVVAFFGAVGLIGVTMIRPTQASLMPQLSDTPEELTSANVAVGFLAAGSMLVGPAIASGVLALASTTVVLLVGGGMLLLGALFVLSVHRATPVEAAISERVDLLGGFRELGRNAGVAIIVVLLALQAAAWGMVDVLSVSLAIRELGLGASGVGVLTAAVGVGAIVGGATSVALVGRRRLSVPFAIGVALWGVPLLVLGPAGATLPVLVLLAVAGAGFLLLDVAGRTLLQRAASEEALGRVFGLLESGFMGAWAVGSVLAPVALHLVGLGWAFAVAGGLVPVCTLVTWKLLATADRDATLPGPELALLRAIPMLHPLSEAVLERMARNVAPTSAVAQTLLIREGDPGELFYVIVEGEVQISIREEEIARYGPGDYFGEIALLRDVPRQASVRALSDVELLTLDRAHFLAAITGSSSAASAAHEAIERRLGEPPT